MTTNTPTTPPSTADRFPKELLHRFIYGIGILVASAILMFLGWIFKLPYEAIIIWSWTAMIGAWLTAYALHDGEKYV